MDFLLNDFEISYTYSATVYTSAKSGFKSLRNHAIAFAPLYRGIIHTDSVLNSRQIRQDTLFDLPYAREEASYVHNVLGGELYINGSASESIYKRNAAMFPIIHLAMHTVINDESPAYSKLIFSKDSDIENDGFLNTYEIYSTTLSARMVVVSACNTGSGKLMAGEGVMSLARGFISAGSESVVMSLWEVHDLSGTEVVKLFYRNLFRGMNKSAALRMAKMDFLEESAQYQAHPFYWSTLVLYGNTDGIFYDKGILIGVILMLMAVTAIVIRVFFYLRSR
jgi:CHAT domain-containing protein